MTAKWYYAKNGQKAGPVTDHQLRQLAETGKLAPTDALWREGMAEWRQAATFKGLFSNGSEPQVPGDNSAAKRMWDSMGKMAERIGSVTAESLGQDEFQENKPAIFLHDQYFGGRTRIGSNLKPLQTFGGKVVAGFLSWFYLSSVLKGTVSSWQFLPFSHTEYARITLRQSLRWDRLFPVVAVWIIFMLAITLSSAALAIMTRGVGALAFPVGWVIANLIACQMIAGFELSELHRTEIIFEYGFPQKHLLLFGISDAPIDQQMEGVLLLCEALSKAEFSRWEQFTAHTNSPSSMLSKVVSMVPGRG